MTDSNLTAPSEEWRPVVGWEALYSVSSFGRVRRCRAYHSRHAGLTMIGRVDRYGYRTMLLQHQGRRWYVTLHRLVADAFLGARPAGAEVNHKDTIKLNNVASNLEYLTKAEHEAHSVRFNLKCHGEHHHSARLTSKKVATIREMLASGCTQEWVAVKFGVSQGVVSRIKRRRIWKHV